MSEPNCVFLKFKNKNFPVKIEIISDQKNQKNYIFSYL